MKTGLTKRQKDTVICFNEESDIIDVRTHNTDLRNRLLEFSEQYPECCKLTDDDEQGGMLFEILKGRLSFRLTAPYSEERRNSLSDYAKKHGINQSKAMNIGVYFEEQNIDTLTTDSEMFIGLYSVMAQSESENISANIKWGIRQRMKNGTYAFKFNTYGYKKGLDGEPEIVPEEAEFIKRIFHLYLDGYSTSNIAKDINEKGARTRKGNLWDDKRVQDVLSNEKYVGDLLYQKTYSSDCIGKKRKKNNGELPKYLISNNHTPIISREVFKLAQSERAKRNAKRKKGYSGVTELGKYSSKYALTDVLVCGECGSSCRRITKSYKDKKFIYWKCINRLENGSKFCNKSVGIREEVLHAAICKAIARIAPSSAEVFNSIETTLEYAITKDDVVLNKYNIELNIKQLQDEAEDYMMKAACTEGDKSRYLDEVEKIFAKVKVLREQLEVLEASVQSTEANAYEKNRISQLLQKQGFEITEYDDMLVRRLIECIKIMSNKTIVVIFKGGFEVTESLQE